MITRTTVRDRHATTIFTISGDTIQVQGAGRSLTLKNNEVQAGGSTLYRIKDDRLEDNIDGQTYWLKSDAATGSVEGKHFHFNYSGKRVRTNKGDVLIFSEDVDLGLAAVLTLEYVTGRVFERGQSSLHTLGVLLGGAEMIRVLEKDGLGLKNLGRFGFYNSLSPQAQDSLLMALGTKFAVQNGLSLRKIMGWVALGSLKKETQRALVSAYAGRNFLKKGNFSFLFSALLASQFDYFTTLRFAKFYAAKEYFEKKKVYQIENDSETAEDKKDDERSLVRSSEQVVSRDVKSKESHSYERHKTGPGAGATHTIVSTYSSTEAKDHNDHQDPPRKGKFKGCLIKGCLTVVLMFFALIALALVIGTFSGETHKLNVVAKEPTWLQVKSSGKVIYEGTLKPEQEIHLENKAPFHLWMGNAGGITLEYDGKTFPVPGKSGQVLKDYIVGN